MIKFRVRAADVQAGMASEVRKQRYEIPVRVWFPIEAEIEADLDAPVEIDHFEGVDLQAEEDVLWRCDDYDDDVMFDLLEWVERVRPWLTHGSNPILDLLEELALPERPAHGWTEDVVKQFYFSPGKEPQIDQPQT